jgi:hypothetical protein
MSNSEYYAVITGDIVGSSKINQRSELISVLKSSFLSVTTIKDVEPDMIRAPFEIHRGDSFQGVLLEPQLALKVAVFIRANLRFGLETKKRRSALDARMVIGIGTIDYLPDVRGSEGDGEAFRNSGPILDKMRGEQRLLVRSPWSGIHQELDTECTLLDAIIHRWSAKQAQAVHCYLQGFTQERIASELGISQTAVQIRLKDAGGAGILSICNRYKDIILKNISPGTYNDEL